MELLARTFSPRRRGQEINELFRLHSTVMEHCEPTELPTVPRMDTGSLLKNVRQGLVSVPSLRRRVHLESPLWGPIEIPRHFVPERDAGNMGLIGCLCELSIRMFILCGYNDTLSEHKGGLDKYVADWRKTLYLMQLSQSERYVRQFEGLDGLDVYAARYFFNKRDFARSFALNLFPADLFETLGWYTDGTPGVLRERAFIVEKSYRRLHERLLTSMQDVHVQSPRCDLKEFARKMLAKRGQWEMYATRGVWHDSIQRLGQVYWSLDRKNLDMGEVDRILEKHGVDYRRMQETYNEFVGLAEEDLLSTEDLSKIAVQRGLMMQEVRGVFTKKGRDVLLKIFRRYDIRTDELDGLLKQNAFWWVVRRIVLWNYLPQDDRPDLLTFVGAGVDGKWEYGIEWINRQFDDPENTGPLYAHARAVYRGYFVARTRRIREHQARKVRSIKSGAHRTRIVINEGRVPTESDELAPAEKQAIARLDALEELADNYQDDLSESWYDSFVGDVERARSRIERGARPDERTITSLVGRLKQALGKVLGDPDKATKLIEAALA